MKHYLFLILTLFAINTFAQDFLFQLYNTGEDYNNNALSTTYKAIINEDSDVHFVIKKFIDAKTGEKIKKGKNAWAIRYNNSNYFNLSYSKYDSAQGIFVKFNLEGRYCVVAIDKNSPFMSPTEHYGPGVLQLILAEEASKWHKKWLDKEGVKKGIFIIDTVIENSNFHSSSAKVLNAKRLKKLIKKNKLPIDTKTLTELSFEEVMDIIKLANSKIEILIKTK